MQLKTGETVTVTGRNPLAIDEALVSEALMQVRGCGSFVKEAVDMGRIVGKTNCVPVTAQDTFIRARRRNRPWKTRFVFDRDPEDTRFITVLLAFNPGGYNIVAVYFGEVAPAEPEDERAFDREARPGDARAAARLFWQGHALVFGSEEIICPYCNLTVITKAELAGESLAGGLRSGSLVLCPGCWESRD